jgi:hypothetical protein
VSTPIARRAAPPAAAINRRLDRCVLIRTQSSPDRLLSPPLAQPAPADR